MKLVLQLVLSLILVTSYVPAQTAGGLEIGQAVPNFSLVNQNGHRMQLDDYKGKVVVVTFLFTRCPDPSKCPLLASKLEKLQDLTNKMEETRNRVQLVSISLDPKYDSPEVLKRYAQLHHARNWDFLTGKSRDVLKVASLFGEMYFDEKGSVVHNTRTCLLSPDLRLRKVFTDNQWKMSEMAGTIRELLKN